MQKKEYSVYSEHSPLRNVLAAISDKWPILLISILSHRTVNTQPHESV